MKSNDAFTSTCRHCRFYSPEGRRGGHCSQLNVSVQSTWKACSLATRIFEPEWEFSGLPVWHSETAFARQADSEGQPFTYVVEPVETKSEVSVTSI
ncbi:hypothetical protein [Leptolyngbya sp. NIES-2104]|uniref:hypothetical protein n=1 Tax=Leptolyngbya sp. NIES-2104 TaxID=1552121 RepID=UPI00073F214B|nr:hypothetical protein [Leptolyngbya sp. NIES-2104]